MRDKQVTCNVCVGLSGLVLAPFKPEKREREREGFIKRQSQSQIERRFEPASQPASEQANNNSLVIIAVE